MTELTLFFAPDTCSRVTMIALEEVGVPYSVEVIRFMKGDHRSAAFLSINPAGKVPALVVDGAPLTENVAILSWLADTFPDAGLLPGISGLDRYRQLADLAYCASVLHPIVTRIRIPHWFCDLPDAPPRVFTMAETAMRLHFDTIEERLQTSAWWYGDHWSIIDAYINWVWFRVAGTDFDTSDYPRFSAHDFRMQERPSVVRALVRSAEIAADLAAQGLGVSFNAGAIKPAAQ